MKHRGHGTGVLLAAVAALLGAGCAGRGVLYPAVGLYGAVPPAPLVEGRYTRGQYEGVGFHATVDLAAQVVSRLEIGGGLRVYPGVGYKGICPVDPVQHPECSGRPYTSNALSILIGDFLVLRARFLPWHAEHQRGRRLSLLSTFRAGLVMPFRRDPEQVPGLYLSSDWNGWPPGILPWALGVGVGARYPLSSAIVLALDLDASWLFPSEEYYGTLTIFTIRAGPVLRF